MPAQFLTGINGAVTLPSGHAARLRAWSLSVNQEIHDVTNFDSTGDWHECIAGLKSWSGVASGFVRDDEASLDPNADAPASGAIALGVKGSGSQYAGNCIISNIAIGQAVDGVCSIAFAFVGNGALTETWDVSG
jgi:predicted secreted protein